MIDEKIYVTKLLSVENYNDFENIYNDFIIHAKDEYKFELTPLDFESFIESVSKKLIQCLVLYRNSTAVAFMVYTTAISEAIELNIIHTLNMENITEYGCILIEKFLELTNLDRYQKIVCYPMLGKQKSLISDISKFGFKFVGIAVLRFLMAGTNSKDIFEISYLPNLEPKYKLDTWNENYLRQAVAVVHEAFETSADALFDPRFKSLDGTFDILNKITKDVYAEFLPEATTVLLYDDEPVGFCFSNLTNGSIANFPIVAISKKHQGKGLSKHILHKSMSKIISYQKNAEKPISEINTCTETNNFQALKMYRHLGFKEDYNYPQSYLPIKK
ncbi:MAG: GNAT family N-acetyltransferase [Candidatus Gastranaerophilales bacterium]